jgi:hypothetical protein
MRGINLIGLLPHILPKQTASVQNKGNHEIDASNNRKNLLPFRSSLEMDGIHLASLTLMIEQSVVRITLRYDPI